jgi:hypothetical protein
MPSGITTGITLPVYRSDDGGLTYSLVTTCVISNTLMCTFVTNHFSLFAVGAPIVSTTGRSPTTGPGGPSYGYGNNGFFGLILNNTMNTGSMLVPPKKDIVRRLVTRMNANLKNRIVRNVKVTPIISKKFYRVNVANSLNVRSSKIFTTKNIV